MAYGNNYSGYGYYGGAQGMNTAPIFSPQHSQMAPNVPINSIGNGGILWVQGEAGAKSYLVAPGNTVQLMDSEANRFYLKTVGADNMPHPLRIFEYKEVIPVESQIPPSPANAVTREEYDALKVQMDDLLRKFDQISIKGGDE